MSVVVPVWKSEATLKPLVFALGVIGEYVARMHVRIMERPAYVIREVAESVDDAELP